MTNSTIIRAGMTDIRQQSAQAVTNALQQAYSGSGNAASIAAAIEAAVFDAHNGETGNAYRTQMRSLTLDLGKNNVEMAQKLLDGQVDPQKVVTGGPEALRTAQRAQQDENLQRQNMQNALGQEKIPVAIGAQGQGPAAVDANLADAGEAGLHEASLGEEGDFKARNQPKIQGLEGIEFESGM